jgi:DNA-binding PadR family transcriptional regulator
MSSEYLKGTLKTIILKLLAEQGKMYGYEISQRVTEISAGELRLTYGALYPVLYKLEGEGYLLTNTEVVDGRARKYYSVTPEGKAAAKQKVSELKRFNDLLNNLLADRPKGKMALAWNA